MTDESNEDQKKCMQAAGPMLVSMHEAWQAAFDRYQQYDPAFIAEHDDTTAANCIRSHMLTEVISRYEGKPGFTLIRLRGLSLLNYRDTLLWRFKKVDGSGLHQNYQTQQQKDYDDQLELPGIPPAATRLTSGYQPDASGQMIERVIVSRPLGRSIMWASQINVIDGDAAWEDITPARLPGTARFDYRRRRSGEDT